jgi:shikimate kinase
MTTPRLVVVIVPLLLATLLAGTALSFAPPPVAPPAIHHGGHQQHRLRRASSSSPSSVPPTGSRRRPAARGARRAAAAAAATALSAGGFEWEDPTSDAADPGVENPFKNPALLLGTPSPSSSSPPDGNGGGDPSLKVDPARLLSPRLQGCNLYLIGMMGSGKSAVGDAIARRMGTYNFLDTDAILERATGMSVPRIFEEEGEEAFRDAEAQVLDSVHAHVRCVISTGGGAVLRNQNWSKLQTGLVVYLKVDADVIYERIRGTDRPLLQVDDPLGELRRLTGERRDRYEQADVVVEVTADMDVQAAADRCVRALHDFIDDNPPAWKKAKAKARAEGLNWVN